MTERAKISRYLTRNAREVIDSLEAPVNMLWMHAHLINNQTGEEVGLLRVREALPAGHHLLYSVGLQPQGEVTLHRWMPRFDLKLTLDDFRTLHTMLMKLKALDLAFLAGDIPPDPLTILSEISDRLCFEVHYKVMEDHVGACDCHLKSECDALHVYTLMGGERMDIGSFTLHHGIDDMTALILEAERIFAILESKEPVEVAAIQRIPSRTELFFVRKPRPVLRII
jgi:hypothetical protein